MTMESGLNVMVGMDLFAAVLYGANMAGVILGFAGGTEAFYFAAQVFKIPVLLDLNTSLLAISSLVISLVLIPRFFGYLYVKGDN
jgi:hypothetical protein